MRANHPKHDRILVALTPTTGRDAAFEHALALATRSGAELYLLHAVPADRPFSYRAAERLVRAADLRKRAEAAGVTAMTVEQHGDPAGIIALHADARQVDLIVMGSERRTGWARLRRPSVAERVLRRTTVPALVVSNDDPADGPAFENVRLMRRGSTAARVLRNTGGALLVIPPAAAQTADGRLYFSGVLRLFHRSRTADSRNTGNDQPYLIASPRTQNVTRKPAIIAAERPVPAAVSAM